ncbi:transposase [Thomasclavelia cocleata]
MPYLITLLSLYNKRWGIETSFREVKYTLGLNDCILKKESLYNRRYMQNLSYTIFVKGSYK